MKLVEWLSNVSATLLYGEVNVKLIVHDGQVRRVVKTVVKSEELGGSEVEHRD